MAITLVGSVQEGNASNGDDVTLTFDGTPAENDVAIIVGSVGDSGSGAIAAPTGYTEIVLQDTGSESYSGGVWYKVMGATPDTSVTLVGTGSAQEATSAVSYMLRGVDTASVTDATPTKTGPSSGSDPDPPSITTNTDGAWVLAAAVGNSSDSDRFLPTGYGDEAYAQGVDTRRSSAWLVSKEVATAGAEDPGATSSWNSHDYTVWSIAIKPASASDPIDLTHLDASPSFPSPTVAHASIDLTHLDASPTFPTPTLLVASIELTHLDASPTFPTGVVAHLSVDLTHLDASATFPTGIVAHASVDLDHLDASPSFPTLSVVALSGALDIDLLDASPTFPTIIVGATTIDLDHLDASPSFPSGALVGTVTLDLLDASPSFAEPVVRSITIFLDLLDASPSFPTLSIFEFVSHTPGRTYADINAQTAVIDIDPHLNSVTINNPITWPSVDDDNETEA